MEYKDLFNEPKNEINAIADALNKAIKACEEMDKGDFANEDAEIECAATILGNTKKAQKLVEKLDRKLLAVSAKLNNKLLV